MAVAYQSKRLSTKELLKVEGGYMPQCLPQLATPVVSTTPSTPSVDCHLNTHTLLTTKSVTTMTRGGSRLLGQNIWGLSTIWGPVPPPRLSVKPPLTMTRRLRNATSISAELCHSIRLQLYLLSHLLSGNSLRLSVHTHCASVHRAAKLVAAVLKVAVVTAGLAEGK